MKEKVKKKLEKVKLWWARNSDNVLYYALVGGTLFAVIGIAKLFGDVGYEIGREEMGKSDSKNLLGEYEAHDAGFIKYFDPSTGTEISRKEALELFKKS